MHFYNVISIVLEKEESPFTQNIKQDSFQREAGDQEDPIIRHSMWGEAFILSLSDTG